MTVKTTLPKDPGTARQWFVVDAAEKALGRVAVDVANVLRGKTKATYSPQVDIGDFVVVVNAQRVKLTGRKEEQKIYKNFSGFRGGLKQVSAAAVRERKPERLIEQAVKGMLPRNNLARNMMTRLKVYGGSGHPHVAQAPVAMEVAK